MKGCLDRSDDRVPLAGQGDEGVREAFRRVVRERMPFYPHYVERCGLPAANPASAEPAPSRP